MARRGYTAIGSVRSDEKAEFLHKEAGEAGVVVGHLLLDVTDAERCARVIEDVGPLYALVNNAGRRMDGRRRGRGGRRG